MGKTNTGTQSGKIITIHRIEISILVFEQELVEERRK